LSRDSKAIYRPASPGLCREILGGSNAPTLVKAVPGGPPALRAGRPPAPGSGPRPPDRRAGLRALRDDGRKGAGIGGRKAIGLDRYCIVSQ
jgi:hypothetical protein